MKMFKLILVVLLAVCSTLSVNAIVEIRHEVGISGGYGMSALNYALKDPLFDNNVHMLKDWGGEGTLSYTFFFNRNWGIGTSLGMSYYKSTAILSGNTINATGYKLVDLNMQEHNYTLATTLNYYEEQQSVRAFTLPLYVQFQTSGWHNFYARLGLKLAFPMDATYTIKNGQITLQPRIIDEDNYLPEEYYTVDKNDKLQLGSGLMFMSEIGAKWNPTPNFSIYTGVYFDYGAIIDMQDAYKSPLIQGDYTTDVETTYAINSILHSRNGLDGAELTGLISPMALGFVVRLVMGTAYVSYMDNSSPVMSPMTPMQTSNSVQTTNTRTQYQTTTVPQQMPAYPVVVVPQTNQYGGSTYDASREKPRDGRRINIETGAAVGESTLVQVYDASGVLVHEHTAIGAIVTVEVPFRRGSYLIHAGRIMKRVIVE